MNNTLKYLKGFTALALIGILISGCSNSPMSEAERDLLMAECQLIEDDMERAQCLERLALGDEAEPIEQVEPVQP